MGFVLFEDLFGMGLEVCLCVCVGGGGVGFVQKGV